MDERAVTEDAVVDELYGGSLDDFLPTRTERSRQARAAGDRPLALRIAALRKPTVGAWLVNQVVRQHPDQVAALTEVAEQLRSAHQRADGDLIRAAGRERRTLLQQLDSVVRQVARAADHRLGTEQAGQVSRTFQAALVDPAALRAIRSGQLSATVEQGADVLEGWPGMDSPPPRVGPVRTGPPEFPPPPAQPATRPVRTRRPEPTTPPPQSEPPPPQPQPEPPPPPPPPPPPSEELIRATRRAHDSEAARERADQDLATAQEQANRTRERAEVARSLLTKAIREHEEAVTAVAIARAALTAADREAKAAYQAMVALRD
ncbi:MAG TPA: hypothetical protein VH352_07180 [Pseudonocardiaceae bacterium]|nr:hypothetical protein [Pseudonocardiaceae bacterium]